MPKSTVGKLSLGLIILMPILFLIGTSFSDTLYEGVRSGETILKDITGRPALALTMLTGMGAGVAAFITGLIGLIKQKERALLVYASTVIGGLFVIYLIAELAFPH